MSETLIGSLWGGLVVLVGSILTWLATRGKNRADATLSAAQLEAQQRREDIATLIETMQEEMTAMRVELREVKRENRECLADRDQMRSEIRRLTRRLEEVEKHDGGC